MSKNIKKTIKKFLIKIPIIRDVYIFISKQKTKRIAKKENAIFKECGEQTLKNICSILNNSDFTYFVDMGTLLGIVRDGRLLSHDKDIDIGLIINQNDIKKFKDFMRNHNYLLISSYRLQSVGITQLSYRINSIRVDFLVYFKELKTYIAFLFYLKDSKYIGDDYDVVQLKSSYFGNPKKFIYNGYSIYIPKFEREYLTERYGEWTVPNSNYIYFQGPSARSIVEKGFIEHE